MPDTNDISAQYAVSAAAAIAELRRLCREGDQYYGSWSPLLHRGSVLGVLERCGV